MTRRGALGWLGAALGLGYLAAMAAGGAMPVRRQLVRSEAAGVLKPAPERIRRVALSRGAERLELVRTGEKRWATADGADVGPEAGERLSMAVQMMHRSAPVRELAAEELAGVDLAPFELDPPLLVAALYGADGDAVLVARFGGRNPEGFLQYMRLDGDPRLYLMSRFIGEEWSEAMSLAAGR